MKRSSLVSWLLAVIATAVLLPQLASAGMGEPFRWYGIGGEMTSDSGQPKRWLGRIGVSDQMGVEVLFAMQHTSCGIAGQDCDLTRVDIGGGVIYDVAPAAELTPYLAGRFILTMAGDGESETSGTIEAACGVEYVIIKRFGISGELNFSVHTDPSQVLTGTRVRLYFYF
jgi:hypothetical protein